MAGEEFLIDLDHHPWLKGRILLDSTPQGFMVDISLIQAETRKIYYPIKIVYGFQDQEIALEEAMDILARFLKEKKNPV